MRKREHGKSEDIDRVPPCTSIATEVDPGHMEDGEDGVQDTEGLEGVRTVPEKGAKLIEELAEESMDVVGSDGKA
jgi:hypothetical protein